MTDWDEVPFHRSSHSDVNGGQCVEVGFHPGVFHKSSRSSTNGGNCVEVAFRKSSRSDTTGGECVEVAFRPGLVAVRDSKCPDGGLIELSASAWAEALASLPRGGCRD